MKRLSGRIISEMSIRLNFTDSDDLYLPAQDSVLISGRVPAGIKGEEWLMSVNGGTGEFKNATGQAKVEKLISVNESCLDTFRVTLDAKALRGC